MIRPATFVCALLAFGSGLYLYQSKHRAQMLDREIARTVKDTGAANDRINILKAEYQLLNEPERLQGLAQQYLAIRPMAPAQTVALADLGQRLPAPLPASAFAPSTEEPVAATPVAQAVPVPAPAPTVMASLAAVQRPAPRPPAPPAPVAAVVTAAATPLPPRPVEAPAPRPAPRRMPEPPSQSLIGPAVAAPLAPAVPMTPRPALVQRVAATMPAPAQLVTAAAAPFAFPSAPQTVASSLGMASRASLLPPPVPVH